MGEKLLFEVDWLSGLESCTHLSYEGGDYFTPFLKMFSKFWFRIKICKGVGGIFEFLKGEGNFYPLSWTRQGYVP